MVIFFQIVAQFYWNNLILVEEHLIYVLRKFGRCIWAKIRDIAKNSSKRKINILKYVLRNWVSEVITFQIVDRSSSNEWSLIEVHHMKISWKFGRCIWAGTRDIVEKSWNRKMENCLYILRNRNPEIKTFHVFDQYSSNHLKLIEKHLAKILRKFCQCIWQNTRDMAKIS